MAVGKVRLMLLSLAGVDTGVIITDTVGRAFHGPAGQCAGWSGMDARRDFQGDKDLIGHKLEITGEAVADEITGFADFLMGERNNGFPAVIFRGCGMWKEHDDLLHHEDGGLIRKLLKNRPGKRVLTVSTHHGHAVPLQYPPG